MKIVINSNFADIAKQIEQGKKQVRYAAAVALTRAAQDVRSALKEEMGRVFDRPTPYTLNSLFLKSATKANLESTVWLKDNPSGKGTPADRYLGPQIFGGARTLKGMERALQSVGLMRQGDYAVPAAGAQLDAYGNVKRSQIVQILSQLRAQLKAGYESRASKSAASRRTVKRQGVTYFAIPNQVRSLKPGIYLRKQFAQGSAVRPVFIFTSKLAYKRRFAFFEIGEKVAQERFPIHFDREFENALKTALLTQQQELFR